VTANRYDMDVGNVRTLAFCDIGPAQGDMFGSISKSIFLGECHGAFAILIHKSELITEFAKIHGGLSTGAAKTDVLIFAGVKHYDW